MTNPNSIVRVHSRNGGRASVLETNMAFQIYDDGLLSGTGVVESGNADMNVVVGGSQNAPDVVVAENASGYKVALDLIGTAQLTITAPASNSRITAIVAYTDDLSITSTEDTVTGNPATCGLIAVDGTTAANPNKPTDAQIRTAITADGATGSQAAYSVVAYITVSAATTVITNSLIQNQNAKRGLALLAHPVGSYYETSDGSFDPNEAWGGTWVEDTSGRILVAQDTATFATLGDTGGAETHTHPLSAQGYAHIAIRSNNTIQYQERSVTDWTATYKGDITNPGDSSATNGFGATLGGVTDSGSTLQPYIVIKRWHRTA